MAEFAPGRNETAVQPPIPTRKLEEITTNACESIFDFVNSYDHSKNTTLQSLIDEASTPTQPPVFKFAVTSTIIQHVTPPGSQLPPADNGDTNGAARSANSIGRRGMHSASGAYWNNEKDGMWNWKYTKGEEKGFDVVLNIMWMSIV
ncbi:MAG: hypothetical protein Q9220_004205 [cf. Caloplaca sp. 1 TL-2023]